MYVTIEVTILYIYHILLTSTQKVIVNIPYYRYLYTQPIGIYYIYLIDIIRAI